jgi:hypothetical protein
VIEYLQFIPRATVFDDLAAFSVNWLTDDPNCRSNLNGTGRVDFVDYSTLAGSGPRNAHMTGFWSDGNVLSPFQEKGYMLLSGMTFFEVDGKVWARAWVCCSPWS